MISCLETNSSFPLERFFCVGEAYNFKSTHLNLTFLFWGKVGEIMLHKIILIGTGTLLFCGTLWGALGYDMRLPMPIGQIYSFSGPGIVDRQDVADLVNLGVAYRDGRGVPQNYGRARELFRKAAMRGDPDAQNNLGEMLANSQGGPRELVEAFAWFTLADYQDQLMAAENLANVRFLMSREQILDGEARTLELAADIRLSGSRERYRQRDGGRDGSTLSGPPLVYVEPVRDERTLDRALEAYAAQNFNTAFVIFRSLAQNGVVRAQAFMGLMFESEQGVKRDFEAARAWYQKAADQGDLMAINNLANLFEEGTSATPQDYRKALELYRTAALNGYAPSQLKLGGIYANGRGGARDLVEAYAWFTLAARQGNGLAQSNLQAVIRQLTPDQLRVGKQRTDEYSREILALKGEGNVGNGRVGKNGGNGGYSCKGCNMKNGRNGKNGGNDGSTFAPTPLRLRATALENRTLNQGLNAFANKDYVTAYQILLPLAKRGNIRAQAFVGTMLRDGLGVERNPGLAKQWYEKALDQGDFLTNNNLAVLYRDGSQDVPRNYARAMELFKKGALMGDEQSQNNLGMMYLQGQGVAKDLVEAYAWFSLAAMQGNVSAQKNLDFVRRKLPANQLQAGNQRIDVLLRIIMGK
jgi:uncharacterized protein